MISVLVAEDHNLVRQGLVKLLEDAGDIKIIGEAADGNEVLRLAQLLRPEVVVLDIVMPLLDGLDALAVLNTMKPKPQVVILSMHTEPAIVRQALRAGALGYVVKQSVADELLAAVRAAKVGSMYLSSDISSVIANDVLVEHPQNLLDRLSPREREVVKRVVEGYSVREIAESLRTSVKTVEKQRRDAARKLEVDNVASLVRVSLELGLTVDKSARPKKT